MLVYSRDRKKAKKYKNKTKPSQIVDKYLTKKKEGKEYISCIICDVILKGIILKFGKKINDFPFYCEYMCLKQNYN